MTRQRILEIAKAALEAHYGFAPVDADFRMNEDDERPGMGSVVAAAIETALNESGVVIKPE